MLINLVLIALFIFSIEYFQEFLVESPRRRGRGGRSSIKYFAIMRYSFTFILAIGASVAFRIIKQKQLQEMKREQQEKEQISAELQHLKYQIQPHFLLNTLNNIYSLTDTYPEKAKTTIHGLSKLMRYLLYSSQKEKVTLEEEIEFLNKYINLMQIRLSNDVSIEVDFTTKKLEKRLPPLLFIPLVENAFKHGVSASKKAYIYVKIDWKNEHELEFIVKNSNHSKDERDQAGSGIGITNLKKRLSILFPEGHTFRQEESEAKYTSELNIIVGENE